MTPNSKKSFHPGDRGFDKRQQAIPGEEAGELVIVAVHNDVRADEYSIQDDGTTLAEVVDNWPPETWHVDIPDDYDPDSDGVVEVAFLESLDWKVSGEWARVDAEELKAMCERNDIPVYSYHRERIALKARNS